MSLFDSIQNFFHKNAKNPQSQIPQEAIETLKTISETVDEISTMTEPLGPIPVQEVLVPITEHELAESNGVIETVVHLQPQGTTPINVKLILELKISHDWVAPPVIVSADECVEQQKIKKKKKKKQKKKKNKLEA